METKRTHLALRTLFALATFSCSLPLISFAQANAGDEQVNAKEEAALTLAADAKVQDCIDKVRSDDFATRKKAMSELLKLKLIEADLRAWAAKQKSPEAKGRRIAIANESRSGTGCVPLAKASFNGLKHAGRESDGSLLYLVKAEHEGKHFIGKFNPKWQLAHIPVYDKEILPTREKTYVYTGSGDWKKKAPVKEWLSLGKTKDGKNIYAARANFNGGIHIGMIVDGETRCTISWGGRTRQFTDFEVLCAAVKK